MILPHEGVKKLKETFIIIQNLDKNMSNLRTWLARIECELSKPVVYDICDDQEIQKKLSEQQDLQQDIEQHNAEVSSVLNICEVLLRDSDACANETECDSIYQTTRSLDRRWSNICSLSSKRRMKIEETWLLWQRFLEDYSHFEEWLNSAERTAAFPNSAEVLYTNAKEELKKFEAFQRQIHERLTQLELINKQYRRLARENRTDSASKLKQKVHEGNQRWDNLQKRVAAILRRLRHFTSQRDEFEGTRDSILVWLTEMDLQLTNVEHFSHCEVDDKMRQLNAFEDEKEASENEMDSEDSKELQNTSWHEKDALAMPQQSLSHLMPPAPGNEKSGRETPASVDSIPLEWDHTVDVGGSSSHEDDDEGDAAYYSALSDVEITESPDAYVKMTAKALKATSGKSSSESHAWHSSDSETARKHPFKQTTSIRHVHPPASAPAASTPIKQGYPSLVSGSGGNGDRLQRMSSELSDIDHQDDEGLVTLEVPDRQSGIIERWEIIRVQAMSNDLQKKQNLKQWEQLNSDLTAITAWLERAEADLDELQKDKPTSSIQEMETNVKKLKEIIKAFDNHKDLVISANLSSKDFQQADRAESKELQNRLRQVNLRWEKACNSRDTWRECLKNDLMQCQEFHETSHSLLLWLESVEQRRLRARILHPNADPHTVLECQKELRQLEKELLEQQPQVNALHDVTKYLLAKPDGEDYIEADERVHVIVKKLKQLLEQVSQDLKTLDMDPSLIAIDELDSPGEQLAAGTSTSLSGRKVGIGTVPQETSEDLSRVASQSEATEDVSRPTSLFYRVLRAALPLQLLLLLLLLLACLIPFSEEDYSCAYSNNFKRSFYPMLRYTNGPPPT